MGRKAKRIALVGTTDHYKDAPFDDQNWKVWVWGKFALEADKYGVPSNYRWDRLFEIHQIWDQNHQGYLKDLAKIKPPKVVSTIIPLKGPAVEVLDRDYLFQKYGAAWLTSTISYALACAIEECPKEIGLWGIDMEAREEFVPQFLGALHLIDLAKSKGIKITMPNECLMRRAPNPYPDSFETIQALTFERKAAKLIKAIERQRKYIRQMVKHNAGKYSEIEDVDEAYERLDLLLGQLSATRYYQRMFVWSPVQAGEPNDGGLGEER